MDHKLIEQAVKVLRDGGLVAIPTETVYGLAGDAENPQAISKIYAAKGRPANRALTVHVAGAEAINSWAVDVPPVVKKLTDAFWPGPLTIVLKRSPRAKDFLTGGQNSVALRCPSDPVAHEVLKLFDEGKGNALAVPSANSFGKLSPSTAQHVKDDLGLKADGGSVDLILDGGACELGIESTILDLTGEKPKILRLGALGIDKISSVLGCKVLYGAEANPPRGLKNYATNHTLEIVAAEYLAGKTQFLARHFQTFGIIAPQTIAKRFSRVSEKAFGYKDEKDLMLHLYDWLRQLDGLNIKKIFVVPPQESSEVLDRLTGACAKKD